MLCMFDNDIQQMIAYLLSVGMEEDEIYKQIVIDGEPTKYYLSNYGKVITLCSGKAREKQLQTDTKGYSYVDLYHHGKRHDTEYINQQENTICVILHYREKSYTIVIPTERIIIIEILSIYRKSIMKSGID